LIFFILSGIISVKACAVFIQTLGVFKCPAEESANCGKLQPINARKNYEKTDIKINKHSWPEHGQLTQIS